MDSLMADTISNPSMEQLFFSVDPMSLILSQNTNTHQLKLLLNGFSGFERGPKYDEYSRLRESKLQIKRDYYNYKHLHQQEETEEKKKQVKFEGNSVISQQEKKQSKFVSKASLVAQSVPDFSVVLRKENRCPVNINATARTPPSSKSRNGGVLSGSASRGSKSASEKKSKGMVMGMARKSYASVQDLKKISVAAASAINGGGVGGRKVGDGGGGGRMILGYRQVY